METYICIRCGKTAQFADTFDAEDAGWGPAFALPDGEEAITDAEQAHDDANIGGSYCPECYK
jgi:hypothetical protein